MGAHTPQGKCPRAAPWSAQQETGLSRRPRSVGAWDRAWDNAKLAFPGAAGRERQRPGDKNGRALVDPLESGFGERHRLDRGPADAARAVPCDLDLAADPLVDEGEGGRPRE